MARLATQTALPLADAELLVLVKSAALLGADEIGGPLSRAERAQLARARRVEVDSRVINELRKAVRGGADPLGTRLCQIRPAVARRPLGAFYTDRVIVDSMTSWALRGQPKRVIDAGCGSGRFAVAIAQSAPAAELVAVDIDPIATLLTRAALACVGGKSARVLHCDYTHLQLAPIAGLTAFVGNPPYVRHHDLSPAIKSWARARASELGLKSSALAGLHAYFYLATAIMARPGDVGCFITSREWLDVGYGSLVRDLIAGQLGGKSLQILDPSAIAFDDVMTTAAIACFEVGGQHRSMRLRSVSRREDLSNLEGGRRVRRDRLAQAPRWTLLVSGRAQPVSESARLRDIARVHRGVVTGNNRFFVMSPARAEELGLSRFCRPAITSAKQILSAPGCVRATATTKVILDLPADLAINRYRRLARYLEGGRRDEVDRGYVTSHRSPWWRIGIGEPAPIVVSYMARQAPVFALNPDGLALLNIAHGIFPHRKMSRKALRRLVDALNGNRETYRGSGRTYHGGLEKFEPGEMEDLPLPASFVVGS